MKHLERIRGIAQAQTRVDLDYAEQMGYDAGRYGPNTTNCHFALFSSVEFKDAWERGKKRGDAERNAASSSGEETT